MLTLKNFDRQTDPTILGRGRDYYNSGAVVSLDEPEKDTWQAEVEGTETYETEVRLKTGNEVSDYSCNCPYEGDLCKHVVATLFAIRNETAKTGGAKERASKRAGFETLLGKLSLDDCRDFIQQYAAKHKDFKAGFELYFADKTEGVDAEKAYEKLVQNLIRNHSDRGFIDYRAGFSLSAEMQQLLQKGNVLLQKKAFNEAFALAKAVLKETVGVLGDSDDSAGKMGGAVSAAIHLLERLTDDRHTPQEIKESVFGFLKTALHDKTYFDFGDFGYEMFGFFERLALALNKPEEFLRFIDDTLPKLTGRYDDYRRNYLVSAKIDFLKGLGRAAEAEALVKQNLDVVEVRRTEVEKAIKKKDFAAAKELIAGGIKTAQKKGHPGTVSAWEKDLLRIAVLEKDTEAVRFYNKRFAFDGLFNREYYRQWKQTYPPGEWKGVIDAFIEESTAGEKKRSTAQSLPQALLHRLAPVYIEEKYFDRLFLLVKAVNKFDTAWQYHEQLVKIYPAELLAIYLPALERKADAANQRSDYADLVQHMKKIAEDIPEATEKIKTLAQRLKEKYPRRPAMAEELNKILR